MTRTATLFAVLATVALTACKDKGSALDTGDSGTGSDDGYSSIDTGKWIDTGTDGGGTDGGGTDGGSSDGGTEASATALELFPTEMLVVPASTWQLRSVVTFDDGVVAAMTADYSSDDEAVVTISETGQVTAVGPGTATITATLDSATDSATVEVVEGLGITVKVVDAETGEPHEGAHVLIGYEQITAELTGELLGSDGGATDGGSTDGGATDGGSTDGGSTDGGATDGGATDGGATDGGATDGGATDGGATDGGATEPEWTVGETDKNGEITFTWTSPEPFTITAWDRERVPTSVFGVVSRELVVPIRLFEDVDVEVGVLSGDVDIDGIPTGGAGDHKVGVALPSMLDGPLLLDDELLIGPSKTIELYGVEADVPGNLYLRDASEEYTLYAKPGQTGVWTVAAPLPIDEVTSGLAGATDALALMLSRLEDMVWGWSDGPVIEEGGTGTADLAPATALTDRYTIDVGELPVGFSGDEDALVLVGETLPEQGFSPVGLGVGTDEVMVYAAEVELGGGERIAMAAAQVHGLGSGNGNGLCTAWAPLDGTTAELPPLQRVPAIYLFDPGSHAFSLETDDRATLVHITLRGGSDYGNEFRDLYFAGGELEDVLPEQNAPFGYGDATWDFVAFETTSGSFHDFVREGWPGDPELAGQSWTAGLLSQEP